MRVLQNDPIKSNTAAVCHSEVLILIMMLVRKIKPTRINSFYSVSQEKEAQKYTTAHVLYIMVQKVIIGDTY